MELSGFSLHFPKELSYSYLWFEGNGYAKKKSDFMKYGSDTMPLFFLDNLLIQNNVGLKITPREMIF